MCQRSSSAVLAAPQPSSELTMEQQDGLHDADPLTSHLSLVKLKTFPIL